MTIKELLKNDEVDFELPIEEFVKSYVFNFNLTEKQLKTKDEIYSLMFYGFMIAINWQLKIGTENITSLRKAQYTLRQKNMKVLRERLFKVENQISSFDFLKTKDSGIYSDMHGAKYIAKNFKDITLYNRYIGFYSLGFFTGTVYAKRRFNKILSTTLIGTDLVGKENITERKIRDTSLPEFIEEFNSFIINNKKILKLK